ncbi:hypothetical protein HYT57_04765 [Candidatus Woesearchaeota archaeon]|nr:hypothetical protein [Candidatus Woesearchaeota archaeon]
MRERIEKGLDKLQKDHPVWYIFLLIIYYGGTLIFGILVGFILSDRLMYAEHYGWFGLSSFSYYNLDKDRFKLTYDENFTVIDQTLKVHSSWKDEIGAITEIVVIPNSTGKINITCEVSSPNQNCKDYEIEGGKHQLLKLKIQIGFPKEQNYKFCFTTREGNNAWNKYHKCVDITVFPMRY